MNIIALEYFYANFLCFSVTINFQLNNLKWFNSIFVWFCCLNEEERLSGSLGKLKILTQKPNSGREQKLRVIDKGMSVQITEKQMS